MREGDAVLGRRKHEAMTQAGDLTSKSEALAEALRRRAWDGEAFARPAFLARLPTMLTEQETRMLAFLARALPLDGPILDLGCFVGGSTLALAQGVKTSPRPDRPIHSFDLFQLNEAIKHRFFYAQGLPFYPGEDGLALYRLLTAGVSDIAVPHKGDVLETLHAESPALAEPPALAFLDLCKSVAVTDHVTRTVFPRLRPGAFIVQQDFIYAYTPWAAYPLWALKDRVRLVGHTDRYSAVFRVEAPIMEADAETACLGEMAQQRLHEALLACLDAVHDWFPFQTQHDPLALARDLVRRYPRARDEWALMRAHRRETGADDRLAAWTALAPDIGA